jgi:hypothetical protein
MCGVHVTPDGVSETKPPRAHAHVRADPSTRREFRALCVSKGTNLEDALGDYMRWSVKQGRLAT